jgi:hypothetical protein
MVAQGEHPKKAKEEKAEPVNKHDDRVLCIACQVQGLLGP